MTLVTSISYTVCIMVLKVGRINRKWCTGPIGLIVPSVDVGIIIMVPSAHWSIIPSSLLLLGGPEALGHRGPAPIRIAIPLIADLGHTRPIVGHGVECILVFDVNN